MNFEFVPNSYSYSLFVILYSYSLFVILYSFLFLTKAKPVPPFSDLTNSYALHFLLNRKCVIRVTGRRFLVEDISPL
jgi:hypothetical protein